MHYFLRWTNNPNNDIKRNFSGHMQAWFNNREDAFADYKKAKSEGQYRPLKPMRDPVSGMWNSDPEWGISGYMFKDEKSFNYAMEQIQDIAWHHQENNKQKLGLFKAKEVETEEGFDGEDLFRGLSFIGYIEPSTSYQDVVRLIKKLNETRKFIVNRLISKLNELHLRQIIKETVEHIENIYEPNYYLDDFYSIDFNSEKDENTALQYIQHVINQVKNLKYPLIVYRGINTKASRVDRGYDNSSWSLKKEVAQGFGDKILTGVIPNSNIIDIEQTIRTRIMNPGEDEVYVPNSKGVIIQ